MSWYMRVPKSHTERLNLDRGTVVRVTEVLPRPEPGGRKEPPDRLYRLNLISGEGFGYIYSLTGWKMAPRPGSGRGRGA
jgi:hypothetical protein